MNYAGRIVVGTGAALNVELGFIPDYARIVNLSDRDIIYEGPLSSVLAFTSGGTDELMAGMIIVQNDAQTTWALVKDVLVQSGTWAGGTAAGFIVLEPGVGSGTFAASKQISVAPARQNPVLAPTGAAGDWGTTGATAYVNTNVETAAAVAGSAANETIAAYGGTIPAGSTEGAGKGIALGSAISEDNKLLHIAAWREAAH